MRKWSILISLSILAFSNIQAKESVIERPVYIARNNTILEIDKIVQNDTATILYLKAFFYPNNWISISKNSYLLDDNGMKYEVKSTEGIPVDTKFYMPDSGETEFQIIFPPLPSNVSRVDFSEGDDNGSWNIWGIELKSHKLPKLELPKIPNTAKANKSTTLPDPVFKEGKARVKGRVLEYREGMDKTLKFYLGSCVRVTANNLDVDIAEDGTFATEIPVITTTPILINIHGQNIQFYVAPEEETIVYINQREIIRSTSKLRKTEKPEGNVAYFDGYMSGIANELVNLRTQFSTSNDFDQLFKDAAGKTVEELRTSFLKDREQRLIDIDAHKMSPASKAILEGDIMLSTIENINMCPAIYAEAYIRANKLNNEEAREFYQNIPALPEDFYDIGFRDFTNINSPQLSYCIGYAGAVGNPYLRERISKATGLDKGFFFELSEVNTVMQQIADFKPASEEQINQVGHVSPFFTTLIQNKNKALAQTIEANKKKTGFKMNEVGEVNNEDLFPSLIAGFRGKVILVDFWATWCGPCLMANKEMKPMKEELKDKDIVYLYIAGDNSPKQTWENMIPDIEGEHFRVSKDQWEYLGNTFGIRGVPTYFIVDREGEITYKTVGYPGANKIKNELNKQLDRASK